MIADEKDNIISGEIFGEVCEYSGRASRRTIVAEPVSPRPVDHAKSTTSMGDVFLAVTGAGWEPLHPSVSLAGSEEQMNFSRQSPKMFIIASDIFIHAFLLLLFLGLFLKIFRSVPLLNLITTGFVEICFEMPMPN